MALNKEFADEFTDLCGRPVCWIIRRVREMQELEMFPPGGIPDQFYMVCSRCRRGVRVDIVDGEIIVHVRKHNNG